MFSPQLIGKAHRLLQDCQKKQIRIVAAESCTGGLVSALLTEIPGSSFVFERGFVTYSNAAKETSLGVNSALIFQHGAVSAEVAVAMARGALAHSNAQLAIAVTGIAGPDGGTSEKPVGLVYIAVAASNGKPVVRQCNFNGDRQGIRLAAVETALEMADSLVKDNKTS